VYTGKITAVGDDYIAYNINTFKGFSGALVFLADGAEQSASVKQEDLGKVLAVHAGYNYGVSSNIGFMIGKSNPRGKRNANER
jgi:V8-like Glu-specific endopeptidase